MIFYSSDTPSQLTASFLIATSAIPRGTYTMMLIFQGPDSPLYSAEPLNVVYLSLKDPPPPPKMTKCIFADIGTYVTVTFNGPSNMGVSVIGSTAFNSSWPCTLIFSFAGVERSSCLWITRWVYSTTIANMTTELTTNANMTTD